MEDERPSDGLDVAVVHGNYLNRGGGERVAEELARTFDAPLYYGLGHPSEEPDDVDCRSLFNDRPFASLVRDRTFLRDLYYVGAFRAVPELTGYDVVVQSGNEPGWYVPPDEQVVVRYTHSPPRNAYDRYQDRAAESGPVFEFYTMMVRQLYRETVPYPDLYVANSELIARRLDRYWDKRDDDVTVVYPPVDTETFGPEHASDSPVSGEYYLVLDRLVPTKHVDEVVEAFRDHPERTLVVAGTGSEAERLERLADGLPNVEFRGFVPEAEKRALLAGAEALCYAAENEDFGIVPIEAFASGTPVVGPREGFTKHQIADGENGVLYDRGPGAIADALDRFERDGVTRSAEDLVAFAEQFDVEAFRQGMREALETAAERADIVGPAERIADAEERPVEGDHR